MLCLKINIDEENMVNAKKKYFCTKRVLFRKRLIYLLDLLYDVQHALDFNKLTFDLIRISRFILPHFVF